MVHFIFLGSARIWGGDAELGFIHNCAHQAKREHSAICILDGITLIVQRKII